MAIIQEPRSPLALNYAEFRKTFFARPLTGALGKGEWRCGRMACQSRSGGFPIAWVLIGIAEFVEVESGKPLLALYRGIVPASAPRDPGEPTGERVEGTSRRSA